MIKTFSGKLGAEDQHRIRLSTKTGKTGYKIQKFETIGIDANTTFENVVKIYNTKQDTVDANIDFGDHNLLAAAIAEGSSASGTSPAQIVIFDYKMFNGDVYVTNKGTTAVNYYIELVTETLTDNANAVSTLRAIRRNPAP